MADDSKDSFPDGINVQKQQATDADLVRRPNKPSLGLSRNATIAIGIAVIAGVSFFGGVAYQKGHGIDIRSASGLQTSARAGFGGRGQRLGGLGTVTAISSSSITITERSFGPNASTNGTSKTYSITSNTAITSDGGTATTGDIATGDTVLIRTASSASTVATEIRINPTMRSPGGRQSGPINSTTNPSDTTTQTTAT